MMGDLFTVYLCAIVIVSLQGLANNWVKLYSIFYTGLRNIEIQQKAEIVFVMTNFILSKATDDQTAFFMKQGFMQHETVEFQRAVLGTITLIGKEILVKFKSPLIIFFPTILIIYLPMFLILLTCVLSPQIFPPLEQASSCLGSS